MRTMKKTELRNRLRLVREPLRILTAVDLKRVTGGGETHDRSDCCSAYHPCNTGPERCEL
jgi:hypothetical protein